MKLKKDIILKKDILSNVQSILLKKGDILICIKDIYFYGYILTVGKKYKISRVEIGGNKDIYVETFDTESGYSKTPNYIPFSPVTNPNRNIAYSPYYISNYIISVNEMRNNKIDIIINEV